MTSIEPNEGLFGEYPESPYIEDAILWIEVYGELLDFTIQLLQAARRELEATQPHRTTFALDHRRVLAHADHYARRLEYWRERAGAAYPAREHAPRTITLRAIQPHIDESFN